MRFACTILFVAEVAPALRFYEAAFGFAPKFTHPSGQYGKLATGATSLAFMQRDVAAAMGARVRPATPDDVAPPFDLALVTDGSEDLNTAYARAVRAGATPLQPPTRMPWGQTVAVVRDPEGFLIEIGGPPSEWGARPDRPRLPHHARTTARLKHSRERVPSGRRRARTPPGGARDAAGRVRRPRRPYRGGRAEGRRAPAHHGIHAGGPAPGSAAERLANRMTGRLV